MDHTRIDTSWCRQKNEGVLLFVVISPNASSTSVVGKFNGRLKIRIAQCAEKGKANTAVINLLANMIGIPVSACTIVSGHTYKEKTIYIENITIDRVRTAFNF